MRSGPSWLRRLQSRLRARTLASRVLQLMRLAILFVEGIIALRILLKLAEANPQAGFTSFVDNVSSPFVGPFHPVFADQLISGHPLEVGSLLAMGVYAVLALAAMRVVRGVFSPAHI